MTSAPKQVPFDFGHQPGFSAVDFLIAGNNGDAHDWIARWPSWPSFALGLWGPPGCGKSHLAHIHCEASAGILLPAQALTKDDVPTLADYPSVVVEDADRGVDEAALFHLFNLLRENRGFLLLTGRDAPARWKIALPDLRSRLSAIPVAAIRSPEDDLLEALLVKLFSDRQLRVGPDVLAFILPRMERSFAAARALVAAIDEAALAQRREISVALARVVMAATSADGENS
ncbi:DnaA ATPase domain-containing protein [Telmatospirillum siberiense]|uniref:DNA replication protein n=1 Tax=Telmatospirillum siberiense TaxID=382514 RepID=A0A2N3PU87_9PROT|nr:DnaA/Hda family protein [Telmatospirillum siberiense]PKU23965.1 DNA replication protein [Telmatospirillum siberiense]